MSANTVPNKFVTIVTGVASERSLASAIARQLLEKNNDIVLTVAGERERLRAEKIARNIPADGGKIISIVTCDVDNEHDLIALQQSLVDNKVTVTGLVHAIGHAAVRDEAGRPQGLLTASPQDQQRSLAISSWSLPRLLKAVQPLLSDDAAVVALTYHGARRAVPGYNMMGVAKAALEACVRYLALELGGSGVRVNAISAGSIRTPAAQAVSGFAERLAVAAATSPLGRTVSTDEVAATAAFLLSPAASGITGQIITCDCGVSIVG